MKAWVLALCAVMVFCMRTHGQEGCAEYLKPDSPLGYSETYDFVEGPDNAFAILYRESNAFGKNRKLVRVWDEDLTLRAEEVVQGKVGWEWDLAHSIGWIGKECYDIFIEVSDGQTKILAQGLNGTKKRKHLLTKNYKKVKAASIHTARSEDGSKLAILSYLLIKKGVSSISLIIVDASSGEVLSTQDIEFPYEKKGLTVSTRPSMLVTNSGNVYFLGYEFRKATKKVHPGEQQIVSWVKPGYFYVAFKTGRATWLEHPRDLYKEEGREFEFRGENVRLVGEDLVYAASLTDEKDGGLKLTGLDRRILGIQISLYEGAKAKHMKVPLSLDIIKKALNEKELERLEKKGSVLIASPEVLYVSRNQEGEFVFLLKEGYSADLVSVRASFENGITSYHRPIYVKEELEDVEGNYVYENKIRRSSYPGSTESTRSHSVFHSHQNGLIALLEVNTTHASLNSTREYFLMFDQLGQLSKVVELSELPCEVGNSVTDITLNSVSGEPLFFSWKKIVGEGLDDVHYRPSIQKLELKP